MFVPQQRKIEAENTTKNTVAPFFVSKPKPIFPDFSTNYQKMLAVKAQEAAQATLDIQPVVYYSPQPQPVYTPPTLSTNDYKSFIYQHESGNNPKSINPHSGACGLGQALPCSKMPCSLTDYNCQDAFFETYMSQRYGSWEAAYNFWLKHSWW